MPRNVLGIQRLDDREALRNLVEALKIAEEAAKQLALTRDQPQWIKVSAALAGVRDRAIEMAR
jgi:hypothetical protein